MKTKAGAASGNRSAPDGCGIVFSCLPENDLFVTLAAAAGRTPARCGTAAEAIRMAPENGAVAVLADGYPEKQTALDAALLAEAAAKNLRIYAEYPAALPGLDVGKP